MRLAWLALAASLVWSGASAQPMKLPPPIVVPPLEAGAKAQPLTVVRSLVEVPDGRPWATFGGNIICAVILDTLKWDASTTEIDTTLFTSALKTELAAAGFTPKEETVDLFGETKPGLQVAVLVKDMEARFCGYARVLGADQDLKDGAIRMQIEWQVYDPLRREVVGRVQTNSAGGFQGWERDWMRAALRGAIRENTRALLADAEFRKVVTAPTMDVAAKPAVDNPAIALLAPAAPARRSIPDASGSVVAIFAGDGHGSGFLVSSDGHLITNHHVVGGAKYVKVRWSDGFETLGEVVRSDRRRDVALVKTDPHGRSPLALRRGGVQPAEAVFALGTPLDPKFQGTVTKGVVSSTRILEGFAYIQSDVTVNPGNSGGPLLDEKGAVVGITVMAYRPQDLPTGINLFIPIGDALDFLNLKPAG